MYRHNEEKLARRRYLAGLATLGSVAVAGCFGDDSRQRDDSETSDATSGPDGPDNGTDEPTAVSPWDAIDPAGEPHYTDDPDWRMHGHDIGNSFINPHAPGPSNNPIVQWTFERNRFAAQVHHPLIVDGTVYTWVQNVPNNDYLPVEDGSFAVVGIDAETGDTETKFTLDEPGTRPVIHDETIYLGSAERVRAYDLHTGEEYWESELTQIFAPSALQLVDDTLVVTDTLVTDDGEEFTPEQCAIDTTTGEVLWESPGDNKGWLNTRLPVIADGYVQHPNTTSMRALDTGQEEGIFPPPRTWQVLRQNELYGLESRGETARLVSHSWETLEERWMYVSDETLLGGWPIVLDDVVVVREAEANCLGIDRENGDLRWRTDYLTGHDDEVGADSLIRVAGSELIYVVMSGGAVTALDPADGAVEWQLNPGDGWSLARGCALADDTLVTVGSSGTLYGIS